MEKTKIVFATGNRGKLREASEILGYDLKKLMFEGSAENLSDTRYAQPAIYTASAMFLEKAGSNGLEAGFVAGHSLGEYSALYAAGVFDFETGLRLVKRRAELMSRQNGRGGMAAILGLDEESVVSLLEKAAPSLVVANLNSKTQVVVSGETEALKAAEKALMAVYGEKDSVKFRLLNVSAAFHSPQMASASREMRDLIEETRFGEPACYVVPNVSGKPTRDAAELKRCLEEQMTGQVRWLDTVLSLKDAGVDRMYEVGHGDVLKKLCKTIFFRPKCEGV